MLPVCIHMYTWQFVGQPSSCTCVHTFDVVTVTLRIMLPGNSDIGVRIVCVYSVGACWWSINDDITVQTCVYLHVHVVCVCSKVVNVYRPFKSSNLYQYKLLTTLQPIEDTNWRGGLPLSGRDDMFVCALLVC